ncbi:hypothetical protein CC78DRAFT_583024 [Lojkania enalia]|uniref:Uncharacterized protein n=1 Tax=Lojkania enalia TaxID=147567 RepID=A0A9P4K5C2_9PLEO|nr:hypothetical protein CC78DRAFT_583024 [Didymosphaeria enalia]
MFSPFLRRASNHFRRHSRHFHHSHRFSSISQRTKCDSYSEFSYQSVEHDRYERHTVTEPFPVHQLTVPFASYTSPRLSRDEVLIIPTSLIKAHITVGKASRLSSFRAAVAGNMKVRDVVVQVVPRAIEYDITVLNYSMGDLAWSYVHMDMRISAMRRHGLRAGRDEARMLLHIVVGKRM